MRYRRDVSPPRRRASFWMPRKKPKRHQGEAQDERFALIFAAPGPHFTGAQLGSLAVIAKARVAQLTGFPSITAAAEGPVTFGYFFYRWKARLLACLGSSAAQGDAGGPGVPPLRTSSASLRSAPVPIPSGLRPSPLDKGSRPPGGRLFWGAPLIRPGERPGKAGGPVCRPCGEKRRNSKI